MAFSKKQQLGVAVESVPNTAASISGTDVLDTLEVSRSVTQNFLDREPTGGTLTRPARPTGTSECEITGRLDFKGSGTATTAPRFARILEAGLWQQLNVHKLNVSATSAAIALGDTLTGETSAAVGIVAAYAPAGSTGILYVPISGTFSAAETIDSAFRGAGVATATGTPVTTNQGLAWKPLSDIEATLELAAGAWTAADPAAGAGIVVKDAGGVVVGELYFISQSGTTLTYAHAWGSISAGNTLTSKSGAGATVTATVHATVPAITQTKGKTLSARYWRDRKTLNVIGGRCSFTAQADAGAAGTLNFTLRGSIASEVDGDKLSASGLSTTTPPRWIGPNGQRGAFFLAGIAFPVSSFSFDAGNTLARRADANATNGDAGGSVTGRSPSITAEVDQVSVQAYDLLAKLQAGTQMSVGVQLGSTAGNRLSIIVPAGQLREYGEGDKDGQATNPLTWDAVGPDLTGDNECYLCHT